MMHSRSRFVFRCLLLVSLGALIACSGSHLWKPTQVSQGVPLWAEEAHGVYDTKQGMVIRGLGVAKEIHNLDLGRETAEQKARADVVTQVEAVLNKLFQSYQTGLSPQEREDFSKRLEQVFYEFGNKTMMSLSITERHWDAKSNSWYVCAQFSSEELKGFLQERSTLSETEKEYAQSHVKKALAQ